MTSLGFGRRSDRTDDLGFMRLAKPSLSLRLLRHSPEQLPHLLRLPRCGEDAVPNPSLRIHLLALRGSHGDGHMGELIRPDPYDHVGPACHTGMNGVLPQEETEGGIIGIRRHAPYGVTWIDVLQTELKALCV